MDLRPHEPEGSLGLRCLISCKGLDSQRVVAGGQVVKAYALDKVRFITISGIVPTFDDAQIPETVSDFKPDRVGELADFVKLDVETQRVIHHDCSGRIGEQGVARAVELPGVRSRVRGVDGADEVQVAEGEPTGLVYGCVDGKLDASSTVVTDHFDFKMNSVTTGE